MPRNRAPVMIPPDDHDRQVCERCLNRMDHRGDKIDLSLQKKRQADNRYREQHGRECRPDGRPDQQHDRPVAFQEDLHKAHRPAEGPEPHEQRKKRMGDKDPEQEEDDDDRGDGGDLPVLCAKTTPRTPPQVGLAPVSNWRLTS